MRAVPENARRSATLSVVLFTGTLADSPLPMPFLRRMAGNVSVVPAFVFTLLL